MKKVFLSGIAAIALSSFGIAGDKFVEPTVVPVTPVVNYDIEGIYIAGAVYYNNVYSVEYNWFNDGTNTQDELAGLTAIIGYNYNEYLSFEARFSKSLFEEDYADEYHFSFFVKPQYRFRDDNNYEDNYFSIYGLLGFGYVNIEGTDGDEPGATEIIGETITSSWNFQYGIGLSYTFVDTDYLESGSGDWSIFAEYTMYMHDKSITPTRLYNYNQNTYDKLSMNGLSVGISYQF